MVSVIIPTYNRETTILKAVKSVLDQTYQDIEVIIVDDGSTDKTKEIIGDIRDKRVKYIRLADNAGACKARNIGIDMAKGDYIAFQDSDDIWRPNKLERQMDFMNKAEADMIFSAIKRFYIYGERETSIFPDKVPPNMPTCNEMFHHLLSENCVSMVTVLCRSECARDTKFDESLPRSQDWDWALRIFRKYHVRFLNEVLVDSYEQQDSLTSSVNKYIKALRIIYEKYKDIIEKDSTLYRQWSFKIADASFRVGLPVAKECFQAFLISGNMKILLKGLVSALGLQNTYLHFWRKKANIRYE